MRRLRALLLVWAACTLVGVVAVAQARPDPVAEEASRRQTWRQRKLVSAAAKGDVDTVAQLLSDGADPNSQSYPEPERGHGQVCAPFARTTPLRAAAVNGCERVVELLLRAGADAKQKDEAGDTPLHLAAGKGHTKVVELLLDAGADPVAKNVREWMPLSLAASSGHWNLVDLMVARGANLKCGGRLLAYAVRAGRTDLVEAMLAAGADPDARVGVGDLGLSSLTIAASRGDQHLVQLLLDKGANPNLRGDHLSDDPPLYGDPDWMPLHAAASNGHTEVVRLLLNAGATPNAACGSGDTALSLAIGGRHTDVAKLLLGKGARTTTRCMQAAAAVGHKDLMVLLLDKGGDPRAKAANGSTLLETASLAGCTDIVELLLTRGADPNVKSKDGSTPLSGAASRDHWDVVELLLARGAGCGGSDRLGRTVLHMAATAGRPDVVRALLDRGANPNSTTQRTRVEEVEREVGRDVDILELIARAVALGDGGARGIPYPLNRILLEDPVPTTPKRTRREHATSEILGGGQTPLHLAAEGGHEEVVELLLARGGDPSAKDNEGETPLHRAAFGFFYDALDRPQSAEPQDRRSELQAKASVCREIMELLLARGANVNARDNAGHTPLYWVKKHRDLADLLRRYGGTE